ncbi:MAG: hypothetical protein M4579_005689 [Chaenotheca gracillima]|nr:MAG: hypothetical protein M4579_005689 [Chaenotheca gracillima]
MSNPVKDFFAHTLDKWASPIITDKVLPETRGKDKHYENRARYFITNRGSYGDIDRSNFKSRFNKDFKEKHSYDKRTNTGTGETLQGEMNKFSK